MYILILVGNIYLQTIDFFLIVNKGLHIFSKTLKQKWYGAEIRTESWRINKCQISVPAAIVSQNERSWNMHLQIYFILIYSIFNIIDISYHIVSFRSNRLSK